MPHSPEIDISLSPLPEFFPVFFDSLDKLAEKYKNARTRAEMLAALRDSYDYGDKVLADLNDQNAMDKVTAMRGEHTNRVGAVLEAFEDQMDHYGNFVVYLRLNGIVPPETENRDNQIEENMHH